MNRGAIAGEAYGFQTLSILKSHGHARNAKAAWWGCIDTTWYERVGDVYRRRERAST
jgi:hypothetical protein